MSYQYTLTLKTHNPNSGIPGFRSGSLTLPPIRYGENLAQQIENLNQYRGPDSQITVLYNLRGEPIDQSLWSLRITDNLTLYIDRPQMRK